MKIKINLETFFLGLVFLLFPIAHFKVTLFGLPLYLSEIPLLMATVFFFFKLQKEKIQWREEWEKNKIFLLGAFLFLFGATLSYLMNEKTLTGLGILKSFFFLPVVLSLLLAVTIKKREEVSFILWLWLAGLAITAWKSLIFFINGWLTYDGRLAGIYESPNYLAMLLAPGILLTLYFFLMTERKILKLGHIFFLIILALALFFTRSYGAITSIFVSTLIFLWLSRGTLSWSMKKIFFISLLFLVGLFAFVLPTQKFQELVHGNERSSLASREMIWKSAIKIAEDNFLFGIGPGNFQAKYLEYQKYFPPYLGWAVPQPHNLYLSLLLQTGILGLAGFLLVLFTILKKWRARWKQKDLSREERLLGTLLYSLLVFYLVYGLIDTPYFKNDLAFACWGGVGFLLAWGKEERL